jgi:hypothetical protein
MFQTRFTRALVVTTIASLVMASAAFADNTISDGDGATPVLDSDLALGAVGCGVLETDTVLVAINRNGSATSTNTFANGATVTVSVFAVTGPGLSASIATADDADEITLPTNWTTLGQNTKSTDTVTADVSLSSSAPGAGSGTITFRSTGLNTGGTSITRDDEMVVTWTTGTCAPPNTSPTVSVTGVTNGAAYEFGSVPAAGCSVTDAEDTGESATPQIGAITGPLSAYGLGSQTVTCSYTDTGTPGLSDSDSVTYTIVDTGAPVISDRGPTTSPNAAGWYNTAVTNTFRATDSGAGFLSPLTNPYDFTQTSGLAEGSAVKINSGTVSDVAGNAATAIDSDPFKIDLTPPTVLVTGVSNGATYILGSAPTAGCSTTDGLSGVQTAATLSSTGGPVGSITATCSGGKDVADNVRAAVSVTYSVIYDFDGFFRPIDNGGVLNVVKAGSSIPVKFSLSGDQGLDIMATGSPSSQRVNCDASAPTDLIETVTAGNSSLSYDPLADQYNYVWKTDKAWAGTCRLLTVTFDDGTSHTALFKFTK